MRASPAFQVEVARFGLWRAAVLVALAGAVSAFALWWLLDDGQRSPSLAIASAVLSLPAVVACASLTRRSAMRLRWDTRCWHLTRATAPADEAAPGTVAVALDLGGWMLLKFEHDLRARVGRVTWLPVQRRGLETHWHALRCAVYSARSAPGHDAGPNPAISPESQE